MAESGAGSSAADGPIPRADAVARLKTDFDRFYFVTGQMDLDLYEPDCVFADPFVAFEGRERFKVLAPCVHDAHVNIICRAHVEYIVGMSSVFSFPCLRQQRGLLGVSW